MVTHAHFFVHHPVFFWCITLFFCTLHLLSHIITLATGRPSNPNIWLSVCHRHPASPQPHVIINLSPFTWFSGTISQRMFNVHCHYVILTAGNADMPCSSSASMRTKTISKK